MPNHIPTSPPSSTDPVSMTVIARKRIRLMRTDSCWSVSHWQRIAPAATTVGQINLGSE